MRFKIEIDCNNAAFEENPLIEVSRILLAEAKKIAYNFDQQTWSDTLLDLNGNKVGKAELK